MPQYLDLLGCEVTSPHLIRLAEPSKGASHPHVELLVAGSQKCFGGGEGGAGGAHSSAAGQAGTVLGQRP